MKILVVDDEQDLCDILQFNLENEGYEVDTVNSAEEALCLPLSDYALILLDVMMGEMSGFQMARRLKDDASTASIPIIFITALDSEDNTVRGLNIGADDYIAKPLSMKEVKARVKAVLRRTAGEQRRRIENRSDNGDTVVCDRLVIDRTSKSVTVDGTAVQLTKIEFELLLLLVSHAGKVFSREKLLDLIWGYDYQGDIRTVDVHVHKLRDKIELNPADPAYIMTKWGVGYYFKTT